MPYFFEIEYEEFPIGQTGYVDTDKDLHNMMYTAANIMKDNFSFYFTFKANRNYEQLRPTYIKDCYTYYVRIDELFVFLGTRMSEKLIQYCQARIDVFRLKYL